MLNSMCDEQLSMDLVSGSGLGISETKNDKTNLTIQHWSSESWNKSSLIIKYQWSFSLRFVFLATVLTWLSY